MVSIEITQARYGPTVVVGVAGELDLATVGRLADALAEAGASDARRIVVDLTGTEFIDSTSVTALLRFQRSLHDRDVEFSLLCPPSRAGIRRVMTLMGVDRAFPIHLNLHDAAGAVDVGDEGPS